MRLKKILHIPNYYPPHIGGIEDVCHSIVSGLLGYHHQIICFNDEKKTKKDIYEGVEVIRCGVIKKLFSQSLSLSFFVELRKVFTDFDPDIVHFHTPNPLSSVYLLALIPEKTKLIVHWHSDIIEQDSLYKLYRPVEKRLLKRADKIIATSPTYVSGSKPLCIWPDKLQIIPNTVNVEKLRKRPGDDVEIEKIKNLYGGKKLVFTFGRHVPYKGLQYLIDAAPLISDAAVVIISGIGPLSDKLQKMANHPSLCFLNRLNDDELRQYLYASDIFAFTSITRNEAFGIALTEAMYCGLPSVTFTIPDSGVNWACPNGETCLESENGNIQALADAVNRLVKNDDLRKRLGKNAFERVEKCFVTEAIKDDLITLYENI
ncbi:mannosyltransferase [Bacteroidia bacterium]|nr:mannosyltransferase [Bacteroidia bacterium]GHV70738.1 mannosyltransferase [Bacteroidia bacterium]